MIADQAEAAEPAWHDGCMTYQYIPNLEGEVTIPQDGILSRTLHNGERARIVVFGFAAGQELTEHTSKLPAIVQILSGEARLKLGADEMDAGAGACAYMPPELPHAIFAKTPVTMALILLK